MGLRDVGATLPPGFRFYPNDEELVCHYLHKKIANEDALKGTLVEIDLHTCEPWQLPEVAKLNTSEWYFFSFRDRKYATGYRTNRATTSGYWKATGKDRVILDPKTKDLVGMRKTLVFYKNRAPNGIKTGWIMHEFRLESPHMPPKEDWVLCRVFHKGKGENENNNNDNNNNNNQCQYMIDYQATTSNASPPPLASPPSTNHLHTIPCGCQQTNSFSSNNPLKPIINHTNMNSNNNNIDPINQIGVNNLNSIQLNQNYNFLINDLITSSVKNDYDYNGLMWGMDLEESSKLGDETSIHHHHHQHQHGFEDHVRFEDDNGTVFI